MQQRVEINSFLVTKLKDAYDSFTKYDIEASIDEVKSEDDHVRLKYKFVLLSNPANVKLSLDGFTTVYGNRQEIAKHLSNDEKNIPRVVNALYQEIFPFLYVTSKTMQIPCPAYRLSEIAKPRQSEETTLGSVEESMEINSDMVKPADNMIESGNPQQIKPRESLIQEEIASTV